MARVIVEHRFETPITDESLSAMAARVDACLEVRNGAWRRSAVSKDRRRMVCEFEAPDAETLREALRTSNLPFGEVWAAEVFAVEDYPEHQKRLEDVLAKSR